MLGLVVPDRDGMHLVDEDVGGHEHRVGEQAQVLARLVRLLLELGHPLELADPGDRPQDPGEFGVLGHLGLVVEEGTVGVDPRRQHHLGRLQPGLSELHGVVGDRHGVQVDDAVVAVVAVLHLPPVVEGSDQVAEVQLAGGLDPREHSLRHNSPSIEKRRGRGRRRRMFRARSDLVGPPPGRRGHHERQDSGVGRRRTSPSPTCG